MENQRKHRNRPEFRERYLQKAREKSREWYSKEENKQRRRKYNKEWWQKRLKELEIIAGRKKPSKCEVCKEEAKIMFDHDHKTGKFRGWICMKCNTILGKVKDSKNILQSLIFYLDNVK